MQILPLELTVKHNAAFIHQFLELPPRGAMDLLHTRLRRYCVDVVVAFFRPLPLLTQLAAHTVSRVLCRALHPTLPFVQAFYGIVL